MLKLFCRISFVFLILIICTNTLATGQQSVVKGFVTDGETEQALQGASVVLENDAETFLGTVTDGDGYYVIQRLPAGTYTLRISFIGFESFEESITFAASGTISRNVILAPGQAELDEVVVQADRESGVTAVSAGLESVVPAQIERVPMPGVTGDLASYLQTMPGITLQGDRGGQFFVRGGALDQNLALIDGMPIYMPFHVLSFYSAFPEEIINNADIYTGGFGAKYGTRMSSVMDVKIRNGNKQNLAGSVSVAPFLSTARIEGPLIKDHLSVIGSVRHSLIEDVMPNMLGQELPYSFGDIFGKVHGFINANHSISFTGIHTYDRGDIAGTQKTFEGDALSTAPVDSNSVAWRNTVYGGKYTYTSRGLPLQMELSANTSEMTNEIGTENSPERTSGIESFDASAHLTYALNNTDINAGFTRRESTLKYELGGQFQGVPEIASNDLVEHDAYVEANFSFPSINLQVQPGVHWYQLPDIDKQWIDPRFRLSFTPESANGKVKLNGAWGIYHQSVAGLNDERDVGNLFTAWLPSPAEAIPESQHAIVGVNVQVKPWLSVAVEGYRKSFENLTVPIFSVLPRFTTALQAASGDAYGYDLRLDFNDRPFWNDSKLDGYMSYAFSKVEYEASSITYTPSHDRRHQFNILLHAERDNIGITAQLQYGSGLPFTESSGFDVFLLLTPDVDVTSDPGQDRILYGSPFEGRQPAYQRLDVWLERRIERGRTVVTLRAGGINILNRNNLFYYDLFTFSRVDQLPFIPSIGLKVELR
ncbi:MAG: carboxypeptidase-like regulatory domain-containing protein [Rhodothermales bacterium]